MTTSIISWNVNGIRAVHKKGFLTWLAQESPDIFCMQETKAHPEQLPIELSEPHGYHAYWASAKKRGYSGVGVYSKEKPRSVTQMNLQEFDDEGRVVVLEYAAFTLINAYFPNSQEGGKRLDYKLNFCAEIQELAHQIRSSGTRVVLCGDYNVAHKEIDLARPDDNRGSPGFFPEECAWMDSFLQSGFRDTFRLFNEEGQNYTWWSYRTRARERNIGWRIDYHCVDDLLASHVKEAKILPEVKGSDHCPVTLTLDL